MSRLKIEIGRYHELVFGRVLEQVESLRGKGELASSGGVTVESLEYPGVFFGRLCVCGDVRGNDDRVFYYLFDTETEAADFVAGALLAVRAVNSAGQSDVTKTTVTLEVVD